MSAEKMEAAVKRLRALACIGGIQLDMAKLESAADSKPLIYLGITRPDGTVHNIATFAANEFFRDIEYVTDPAMTALREAATKLDEEEE